LAKPNYDFAKRQRELAKKAKKEEKLRKKAEGGADSETEGTEADGDDATPTDDPTPPA
jgi:hypothetical protein